MAWENPVTTWGQAGKTVPGAGDFNRIEGNILHLQDTKETPAGAQAKANTAEANAKAYTDAHEQKAAPHSGHETPAGAQAKADAAAGAVQAELNTHKADNTAHGITSKVLGPSSAINGNIAIFDGTTGKKVKDSGITLTTNKGSVLITDTVTPEGKTITIPIGAGKRRGLFVMHVPDEAAKAIVFFGTYEDGAVCIYKYSSSVYVTSESDEYLARYVTGSSGARLTRAYISGSNLCLEFNVPDTSQDINCYVKWEVW